MARAIINRFDRFINIITLLLLISGGMIIHTLTALTLKSYYGDPWGYICFALPGLSEVYLMIVQIADDMYNYTFLFVGFILLSMLIAAVWFIKNMIRHRVDNLLESRN